MYRSSAVWAVVSSLLLSAAVHPLHAAEKYPTLKNAQVQGMLDQIQLDIEREYYDPSLHGIDLDRIFKETRDKIATAQSQDGALLLVAGAVNRLHDSHTSFSPPIRPYLVDYGFRLEAVGDSDCYVGSVRPGSDADVRGLKRGDRIVDINGIALTRQNLSTIEFGYRIFPQSGFHLTTQSPDGASKQLTILAKVIPGQREVTSMDLNAWSHVYRSRDDWKRMAGPENMSQFLVNENKVLFWKLPNFATDPDFLHDDAKRVKSFEAVVLDLRGNPGGRVDTLKELLGVFFEKDVTIDIEKTRHGTKPEIAKGNKNAYRGKLIVLIDSKSSSAAEIFARVVQLENRGTVLGDRSSGRVMEARRFVHAVDMDARNVTQYGAWITVADLLMKDGKTLEGVGVTPDERILPSPADMAAGRDPALARAAALAGAEMTPEQAGAVFKVVWNDKPFRME